MTHVDESLVVECACFTQARRHHQVLGKIGGTVLPFQVTAPALAALAIVGAALVFGWRWWSWVVPTPIDVMVVIVVPITVAIVAQTTKIEGRDPFRAAVAIARYGMRPRRGLVAGRPEPRRRRGVWSAQQLRSWSS